MKKEDSALETLFKALGGFFGVGAIGIGAYFAYRWWQSTQPADTDAGAALPEGGAPVTLASSNNPFLSDFVKAADTAGVPPEWASDVNLTSLVQHESNWKPDATNATSSAFGLFQFIKSTWASYLPEVPYGTIDPYWQAVGGFRYIAKRYQTPDRAWGFWQATVNVARKKMSPEQALELCPEDLRGTAQTWMDKGWAGY